MSTLRVKYSGGAICSIPLPDKRGHLFLQPRMVRMAQREVSDLDRMRGLSQSPLTPIFDAAIEEIELPSFDPEPIPDMPGASSRMIEALEDAAIAAAIRRRAEWANVRAALQDLIDRGVLEVIEDEAGFITMSTPSPEAVAVAQGLAHEAATTTFDDVAARITTAEPKVAQQKWRLILRRERTARS